MIEEEGEEGEGEEEELEYSINATHMNSVVMNGWKPPLLELWAEWGLAGDPAPAPVPTSAPVAVPVARTQNQFQNQRLFQDSEYSQDGELLDRGRVRDEGDDGDRDRDRRMGRESGRDLGVDRGHVVVQGRGQGQAGRVELEAIKEENKEGTVAGRFRQLLGLSRFTPTAQFNDMTALLVCPVGRVNGSLKSDRGDVVVVVAVYLGESKAQAEKLLLNALTPYKDWTKYPVENPYYHLKNGPKSVNQNIQNSPKSVIRNVQNSPILVQDNYERNERSEGNERNNGSEKAGLVRGSNSRRGIIENIESVEAQSISEYGNENDESSIPLPHPYPSSSSSSSSSSSILPPNHTNTPHNTPLTNENTPTMTSSIVARNQSSRSARNSSDVHLLDFSIDGVASFLTSAGRDAGVLESMMGCYIVYKLPCGFRNENEDDDKDKDEDEDEELEDSEDDDVLKNTRHNASVRGRRRRQMNVEGISSSDVNTTNAIDGRLGQCDDNKTTDRRVNDRAKRGGNDEVFKMWWDVDCPVLNSRTRHVFRTRIHSSAHTTSRKDLITDNNSANSSFIDTLNSTYGQLHDKDNSSNNDINDLHSNKMKNDGSIHTMQNNKINNKNNNQNKSENDNENQLKEGLIFTIYCSDAEGNLPSHGDREALAYCHIPYSVLQYILSEAATHTYALPIMFDHPFSEDGFVKSGGSAPVMRLNSTSSTSPSSSSSFLTSSSAPSSSSPTVPISAFVPTTTPTPTPTSYMNLVVSHRLQPALYRSTDSATNTESRDIIARAKAVRTVTDVRSGTDVRVSSVGSRKYSARAAGEEGDGGEEGEGDEGEGEDRDDSVTLSPYEKLQKGLFSWDRMRKRNQAGQMQEQERGQRRGQGQGQGQGQGVDVEDFIDGRGVESFGRRSDNKEVKERQEITVDGVRGTQEEEKGAETEGAEWGTVEVTVGKITNWSKHLLPHTLQAFPSHTANPSYPANTTTGGSEAFLFCVLDPANTLGNEVRTYAPPALIQLNQFHVLKRRSTLTVYVF